MQEHAKKTCLAPRMFQQHSAYAHDNFLPPETVLVLGSTDSSISTARYSTTSCRLPTHWKCEKADIETNAKLTLTHKKQLHSRVITRCNQHSCIVFTCVYYVLVSYNKSDTSGCRCVLMAGRVEQKTKAWCLGNDSKLTSSTSSTVSPCPQFLPQILRQDSAHLSSMQSSPIHFPQLSISCVYSVMIVMLRSWHSSHSSLSLPAIAVPSKRTWKSWNPDDPQRESLRALQGGAPGARHMMQLDATWYELIWCTMWYDICAKQKGSRFCSESVDVSRVIWKTRQSIQKGDKMGVAHCRKAFDVSLHGKLPKSWRWGLATQNRCIEW